MYQTDTLGPGARSPLIVYIRRGEPGVNLCYMSALQAVVVVGVSLVIMAVTIAVMMRMNRPHANRSNVDVTPGRLRGGASATAQATTGGTATATSSAVSAPQFHRSRHRPAVSTSPQVSYELSAF